MLERLKSWWFSEKVNNCENNNPEQEAILRGLEYGVGQLQLKCEDLFVIAGALLVSTGQTEYIIKQEFVKTFLENRMTVGYEIDTQGNIKIALEKEEDVDGD